MKSIVDSLEKEILNLCKERYSALSYLHGIGNNVGRLFIPTPERKSALATKCESLLSSIEELEEKSGNETAIIDARNFLNSFMEEVRVDAAEPYSELESIIYSLWIYLVKSYEVGATELSLPTLEALNDIHMILGLVMKEFGTKSYPRPIIELIASDVEYLKNLARSVIIRFGSEKEGVEAAMNRTVGLAEAFRESLSMADASIVRPKFDSELRLRYGYSKSANQIYSRALSDVDKLLDEASKCAATILKDSTDGTVGAISEAVDYVSSEKFDDDCSVVAPDAPKERFEVISEELSKIYHRFVTHPRQGSINIVNAPEYLNSVLPFASCTPIYKIDIDDIQFIDILGESPRSYLFVDPNGRRSVASMLSTYVHGVCGHSYNFVSVGNSDISPLRKFPLGLSVLTEGLAYLRESDFILCAGQLVNEDRLEELKVLGEKRQHIMRTLEGLTMLAYNWKLVRTVRQVVDIGINSGRMQYDQCIEYIMNHTPYNRTTAKHEMLRFLAYPGYPAGYPLLGAEIEKRREVAIGKGVLAQFNSHVSSLGWISSERLASDLDGWLAGVQY